MKKITSRLGIASVAAFASVSLAACGGTPAASPSSSTPTETANANPVTVLIGSSGEAETASVKKAVAAWSAKSGVKADVIAANNLVQEASQGFASGKPADLLYVSTDQLAGWASNGSLEAYGDKLSNKDDFYEGLKAAFTVEDQFYCAPKDFSTLALFINKKMWADAGLTEADIPKTWDDLSNVAKKLTSGKRVGLAFGPEVQRVGVFMAQNEGSLMSEDGKTATVNSAANVEALTYVKKLMTDGSAAYSSDLGSGWGGEAFGKQQAAMVIEGPWLVGPMAKDYSSVQWVAAELPAGKTQGTLQYTNCWGMAKDGDNKVAAQSLVEFLTSKEQQLAFAKEFGPMPSVKSAADDYKTANPTMVPFINGAAYASNLPAMEGAADAIKELNTGIAQLKAKDPKAILDASQADFEAIVKA